jgi:integrase
LAQLYMRKRSPYFQARLRVGEEKRRVSTGCVDRAEAQRAADELEIAANLKYYSEIHAADAGAPGTYRVIESLNAARNWLRDPNSNPARGLSQGPPRAARKRKRPFPLSEFRRGLRAVRRAGQHRLLILLVMTGLHPEELLRLRWDQINLEERTARINARSGPGSASGASRLCSLSDPALKALLSVPEGDRRGHVIVNPITGGTIPSVEQMWTSLERETGLSRKQISDLCSASEV